MSDQTNSQTPKRGNPKWVKGFKANPTGKNGLDAPISVLARSMVPAAVKRLKKIIEDDNASSAAHIGAVGHVLDRAYGKAPTFSTSDAEAFRKAVDMTDDQLATIAAQVIPLKLVK